MNIAKVLGVVGLAGASIAWLPWPAPVLDSAGQKAATEPCPTKAAGPTHVGADAEASPADEKVELRGLWERPDLPEKDDVRFYFFHPSGIGLYRFGKLGLNHTHMFRYVQAGSKLAIVFSHSGEHHEMTVSRQGEGEGSLLTLSEDPREDGRSVTYRRRKMPSEPSSADFEATGFNRMWIHVQPSQRGTDSFAMYQFQKPDAKGRGHGWFHHGNYDEWTTESLDYAKRGKTLSLDFELTKQDAQTRFQIRRVDDRRLLELERDPRGFWQKRRFVDQGPSFAVAHSMLLDVGLR